MNIVSIYKQFPSQDDCIAHLENVRWKGKPSCPYCKSKKVSSLPKEKRHHCNTCNTSFSVTVGTIFHKTKVDLQKWFVAISIVLNAKKGISARQLARDIQVTKDTAWYMGMRIRRAMAEYEDLLKGIVEMDETYIGGKPRKGKIDNPTPDGKQNIRGRGTDKIPVVGMVERGGKVKAVYHRKLTQKSLANLVRGSVDVDNTQIFTDQFKGYARLKHFIEHKSINHSIGQYVSGNVHTNTIEGFWALLKRGIVGQYHKVTLPYLPRYINEFCYRYNHRNNKEVFEQTISRALGV